MLQQYGPNIYRFPHRTFQEFFAARRLVADDDWDDDEAEFVPRALHRVSKGYYWRYTLLLAVSHQVVISNQISPAVILVDELLAQYPFGDSGWLRNVILAAEVLAEVGRERLARLGQRRVSLFNQVTDALVTVLRYPNIDDIVMLSVAEHVRAGNALGLFGDPRVPTTLEQWKEAIRIAANGDTEGYFCQVGPGNYVIGAADGYDDEQPQQTIMFDQPFWLARYPITNAQWNEWVKLGGTRNHYHHDPRFNTSNQPVVGVSWESCNAFCMWLSEQIGVPVRLPTEYEWEAGARGHDAHRYPWGEEWSHTRANTAEGREAWLTVPVGCYPDGISSCGVHDLIGNVWEWTASIYQSYPGAPLSFHDEGNYVLRGGSCVSQAKRVRCSFRSRLPASYWRYHLGFRIAFSF